MLISDVNPLPVCQFEIIKKLNKQTKKKQKKTISTKGSDKEFLHEILFDCPSQLLIFEIIMGLH